ncbi:3'-to-5' oligoribonuclease (orn) [uncultured Gammaproteobacteria bacterium]|nr:3'-to-5' oligoribonuclease (orn) [Bathymodiolus brooksi thiotrophic gill symbiont]CAC9610983.1 3'-to-5' oligoribonuclease (orn) [uncultured Gammaproteobacteria bacterium]CAC9627789.1 3'-to-5' oligoribonuclease (orn) [uncultured Gammaproteobacteria bacterium]CAC9632927.1 3'-to-5' oligoribonuclease (orn) [uncultured Gammaproteobacteria bacterium]
MNNKETNLIWIDLEMTGLLPEKDVIIEIATIVTDKDLNILAEGPALVIHQNDEILTGMDEWNTEHHTASGLVKRVKDSNVSIQQAEQQTIEFLKKYITAGTSPMCGNTVCQDRRFLYNYMPKLEKFFHYRHIDVSTLKELAVRWKPEAKMIREGESAHLALADIRDSIDELKHYRRTFINV